MNHESHRGSWSPVETGLSASQIGNRMLREVGASGHLLAQKSVGVLIGTSQPRRVWFAEKDLIPVSRVKPPCRCIFALVPGDRSKQLRGRQRLADRPAHRLVHV